MSGNQPPKKEKSNKIFGVMTKRRWFGVVVFLSAMLWAYTVGPPLSDAIVSNQFFKDGVSYDYNTVRFEGDLSLIDSLFKRGFFPHVFTWQVGAYFNWTEGPIFTSEGQLLFSDMIKNRIYSYAPIYGIQIKVENSGDCTEEQLSKYVFPGSNGLLEHPTEANTIFIAQTAQRRIISRNLITNKKTVIATEYDGKPLNSPNDMVLGPNKKYIYFTDPPYGFLTIEQFMTNPNFARDIATRKKSAMDRASDIGFSGVYRVHISGKKPVEMLIDNMHRPNGIAFSTDFSKLFVANSVTDDFEIYVFDVDAKGAVTPSAVWDEKSLRKNAASLPTPISRLRSSTGGFVDGITIHPRGYLITTAANAKLCIIDEKTGDLKAVIKMADGLLLSNVVVAGDENLYVTGNHTVWQLKLQPFQSQSQGGKKDI